VGAGGLRGISLEHARSMTRGEKTEKALSAPPSTRACRRDVQNVVHFSKRNVAYLVIVWSFWRKWFLLEKFFETRMRKKIIIKKPNDVHRC
jgi:hypothetical protein